MTLIKPVSVRTFAPADVHEPTIQAVLNTTVVWATALKTLR